MTTQIFSEPTSGKKKRGRPRSISAGDWEFIVKNFPEIKTTKGLQDKYYAIRGIAVLDGVEGLSWLIDPTGIVRDEPGSLKSSILSGLGRIDDENLMVRAAIQVCKMKPTTKVGVKFIRAIRNDNVDLVDEALREHAGITIEPEMPAVEIGLYSDEELLSLHAECALEIELRDLLPEGVVNG